MPHTLMPHTLRARVQRSTRIRYKCTDGSPSRLQLNSKMFQREWTVRRLCQGCTNLPGTSKVGSIVEE